MPTELVLYLLLKLGHIFHAGSAISAKNPMMFNDGNAVSFHPSGRNIQWMRF
jgi:hypothetical protein